jgi:hypothetical protein
MKHNHRRSFIARNDHKLDEGWLKGPRHGRFGGIGEHDLKLGVEIGEFVSAGASPRGCGELSGKARQKGKHGAKHYVHSRMRFRQRMVLKKMEQLDFENHKKIGNRKSTKFYGKGSRMCL